MAALQCEICGGKLIGKPGGVFECDSCGMEYSTEWAKAKVQEIKGTVKIEGPVEVTGTVKVEGGASVENLLKRGNMLLTEGKWTDAEGYFNRVLELEPENAEAYLGLALVSKKCSNRNSLAKKNLMYLDNNLRQAMKFDSELKVWLDELMQAQRKAKEAKDSSMAKRDPQALIEKQQKLIPLAGLISVGVYHTVGLKADGTVVAVGTSKDAPCDVSGWRDIVAVEAGDFHTVGLKADGTVVSEGDNTFGQCDVSGWTDIVALAAGWKYTVGLRADGTVVAVGHNRSGQCNVDGWTDIVAIAVSRGHTVGLRSDGTLVAVGDNSRGQCNVGGWKLFNSIDTFEQERSEMIAKWENQKKIAALEAEKASIQAELPTLKGMFSGGKRRELEAGWRKLRRS